MDEPTCAICAKPAIDPDPLHPYHQEMSRCIDHLDQYCGTCKHFRHVVGQCALTCYKRQNGNWCEEWERKMSTELKNEVLRLIGDKPPTCDTVQLVIELILQNTGEVSSDDVRFYIKEFEKSRKVIGAAIKELIRKGKLEEVEMRRTDVGSSHGRKIAVYRQPQ
jgi:hypothetical protein